MSNTKIFNEKRYFFYSHLILKSYLIYDLDFWDGYNNKNWKSPEWNIVLTHQGTVGVSNHVKPNLKKNLFFAKFGSQKMETNGFLTKFGSARFG